MSQADELLASLEDASSPHNHLVADGDSHFIIDPNTRQISNVAQVPNVLMQNDHNSEIYTFEVPRLVEGHDMRQCNRIWLHFINTEAGGRRKHEDAVELTAEIDLKNETLTSKWLITRHATQYVGNLSFLLQYLCIDDNGDVTYEWHTDIYSDVTIKKTFDNGQAATVEYTNILEDWYQKLFNTEDSMIADITEEVERQKAVIAAKGAEVIATIPDTYTDLSDKANQAIRTRANAIQHTMTGETITITDSSDDYLRGLKLFGKTTQLTTTGKNLFKHTLTTRTINGATLTVNDDDSITIDGIPTANSILVIGTFTFQPGVSYIFSGCPYSGSDTTYRMDLRNGGTVERLDYGDGVEVIYASGATLDVCIRLEGSSLFGLRNTFRPMIRLASNTDASYEPYSGGVASPSLNYPQKLVPIKNTRIGITGANLFDASKIENRAHSNAVITNNGNGSFTIGGSGRALAYVDSAYIVEPDEFRVMFKPGALRLLADTDTNPSVFVDLYRGDYHVDSLAPSSSIILEEEYFETAEYTLRIGFAAPANSIIVPGVVTPVLTQNADDVAEPFTPLQTISVPYAIHGIPVNAGGNYTDSAGQQWICDEIDFGRGVYIKRIAQQNLKEILNWDTQSGWANKSAFFYRYGLPGAVSVPGYFTRANLMCNRLAIDTPDAILASTKFYDAVGQGAGGGLYVSISDIYDATALKRYFQDNETIVQYVLAEPVETPLSEDELLTFSLLHSNYLTTSVANSQNGYMEVKYNVDTASFLALAQGPSDEQVERYVNAWLERYFVDAEEVSF